MLLKGILRLFVCLCVPLICPVDSFRRQHGELCDWRSPTETCDESRGLACSYKVQRCGCWDIRTIYSLEKNRCVGKAAEECHYFGGERLCTSNAYCLEDESLSPIPICLCLRGFFRAANGSCIRRSKYGEPCDLSARYAGSPSTSSGISSGHSTNSNCEPEAGLQCVNYNGKNTCQCELNQIYDPKRELCISLVGMQCSKTLENCVKNAECSEKIWAFDHVTGETKMIGHRCACKPGGLKVTEEGFCAVPYGGNCSTSSECYSGEGLTCINGQCVCHPLSQVYDKRVRRCLNLVGTKCQASAKQLQQQQHHHKQQQDRQSQHHSAKQQESSERARIDLIKPQQTSSSFAYASEPVNTNTSPFTSAATATYSTSPATTSTPFLLKSRNVTSRNFYFNDLYYHKNNDSNRSVFVSPHHHHHREPQQRASRQHSISRRHFNIALRKESHDTHLPAEHRGLPSSISNETQQQCMHQAECIPSPSSSEAYCTCRKGTSETIMGTCLLEHGEPCGQRKNGDGSVRSEVVECNVFEGLVCMSDTGTCQCADPMLIYDAETRACLSTVGNPCGRMKLNPKLLTTSYYFDTDSKSGGTNKYPDSSSSFTPFPFYQHHSDQFIYINCVANSTCVDKSVNGQFKQVCVTRSKYQPTNSKFAFAS